MAVKANIYNENNGGKIYCNKNIMLSIINLAAKEISGVSSLCAKFGSRIKRMFNASSYFEGVKVSESKDGITIDIYLNVFFGYSVSDVAYRVQENVKNGISSMMDTRINKVNIHVLGVEFSKEELAKNI